MTQIDDQAGGPASQWAEGHRYGLMAVASEAISWTRSLIMCS